MIYRLMEILLREMITENKAISRDREPGLPKVCDTCEMMARGGLLIVNAKDGSNQLGNYSTPRNARATYCPECGKRLKKEH